VKITAAQYAQALYELTKDKPENELGVVVEKFVQDLRDKRLLNRYEEIIRKFVKIYNKENGIIEAKAVTSRSLDDKLVERLKVAVKDRYRAKDVELEVLTDDEVKGGVRIIAGEEILDASIAGRLRKLKKTLAS